MHITKTLAAALFVPAILNFTVPAQDPPATSQPASAPATKSAAQPDAVAEVTRALAALHNRGMLTIRGNVRIEKDDAGAPGAVMIVGGPGGGGSYEGEFEAFEAAGETIITNELEGIGFVIYAVGERLFTRETWSDDHETPGVFREECAALLQRANLQKYFAKSAWTRSQKGELIIYNSQIDKKLVPARKAEGPIPVEKVIRVDASVITNTAGDIIKVEFNITKKNPFASMMRNVRVNGGGNDVDIEATGPGEAPGGAIRINAKDLHAEPKDNEKGPVTHYSFEFPKSDVPPHLLELHKLMKAVAGRSR